MNQTHQIWYHLHMMPYPTLTSWVESNTHKAIGPDEVLTRLLKEAADQFAPIFWALYRQSTVLVEWRTANVVPIFKKGNHAYSANYRPLSLTSICSKVMEHIIISSQIISASRSYSKHNTVSERNARRSWCYHMIWLPQISRQYHPNGHHLIRFF